MPAQLFALPYAPSLEWQVGFAALMGLWVMMEVFTGRIGSGLDSVNSDRGSAFVVIFTTILGIGAAAAIKPMGWLPAGVWAQWLGLAVMVAGLAIRLYSILHLGRMFTRLVEIAPDHRLVTTGPYRLVRHPSYTGLLIFFLGIGLGLGDWLSALAMVGLPLAGIIYRIEVEERALIAAFGEEYRGYKARVSGLIPFVL